MSLGTLVVLANATMSVGCNSLPATPAGHTIRRGPPQALLGGHESLQGLGRSVSKAEPQSHAVRLDLAVRAWPLGDGLTSRWGRQRHHSATRMFSRQTHPLRNHAA